MFTKHRLLNIISSLEKTKASKVKKLQYSLDIMPFELPGLVLEIVKLEEAIDQTKRWLDSYCPEDGCTEARAGYFCAEHYKMWAKRYAKVVREV
jgi:hypothetical protein